MKNVLGQPLIIMEEANSSSMPFNEGKPNESIMAPKSVFYATILEQKMIDDGSLKNNNDISYELNSCGLRCDEFSQTDASSNFLFAGCSFTFGEGLPNDKSWSAILNKSFNMKKYYSLGYCGGSIDYIIQNIYNYLDYYGKPKCIFILFPDIFRKSGMHNNKNVIFLPNKNNKGLGEFLWDTEKSALEYNTNIILDLERYCANNKIPLIWSTWSNEFAKNITNQFDNYVKIKNRKIKNFTVEKNTPYFDRARDGVHPGVSFSYLIADIFKDRYDQIF